MSKQLTKKAVRHGAAGLALAVILCGAAPFAGATTPAPPPTRRDDAVDVLHGVRIPDPYRWLEDQSSAETRAWIAEQDRYTRSILDTLPGRGRLKQRLTELMKVDETRVPLERNGRFFFMQRLADQDLFVLYMRRGLHGQNEVLVDPHPMSPDHSTSVSLMDVSRDGTRMVYGVRQGGQDELTPHVFDVDARRDLPDTLPKARYEGIALKPDLSGLYYSRQNDSGPRIYYHAMGSDPAHDPEIFGQGYGPGDIIGVSLSDDGRYLLIHVLHGAAGDNVEVHVQNLAAHGPIVPVVNDIHARFFGSIGGDHLFLSTDWKAPNGRVLSVDLNHPEARGEWKEVIPEGPAAIQDVSAIAGKLFVTYLQDVSSRVRIFDPSGQSTGEISLPGLGSVDALNGQWQGNDVLFDYTSFVVPPRIYRYDAASASEEVWAETRTPVDTTRFETRQVWYTSKGGTRVPMFLIYQKGRQLDGERPTYLTGYGGFDISLTPRFSSTAVAWVENGGVFALPNLRGGGEFGEKWHQAGMREKKQNVFDDFYGAAQYLIDNHYTSPAKLAISGTSNGGLLVGAALTQRPDLFRAVVCRYPLLDMLRYQDFLVARFWVPEYGSAENAEQFKYLDAYSPYQNVRRGVKYPAVLFVSGDGDTRVAPLHARKMAAMVQWATGSDYPVLLDYDTTSGHSGGRPLSKQIDESVDELSFLMWQLGGQVH